jgi:formylglycine-generating enzyme required for sulfatase activity
VKSIPIPALLIEHQGQVLGVKSCAHQAQVFTLVWDLIRSPYPMTHTSTGTAPPCIRVRWAFARTISSRRSCTRPISGTRDRARIQERPDGGRDRIQRAGRRGATTSTAGVQLLAMSLLASCQPLRKGGAPLTVSASRAQPESSAGQSRSGADSEPDRTASPTMVAADMLRISGGSFTAAAADETFNQHWEPAWVGGRRQVDPFLLDRTEVTVSAYAQCVAAGVCSDRVKSLGTAFDPKNDVYCRYQDCAKLSDDCNYNHVDERALHPINCVDWQDADAFCRWRSKRLPTALEWEYAVRAGAEDRVFPWGAAAPAPIYFNGCGQECRSVVVTTYSASQGREVRVSPNYHARDPWPTTAPVGSFPALPWGLRDLAGNVSEWTASRLTALRQCPEPQCGLPGQPGPGAFAVVEGSSYADGAIERIAFSERAWTDVWSLELRLPEIGFRCARTARFEAP